MDPKEIIDFLQTAARSVGAEVTSPWFYLQLGLILAAAGIAYAAEAALRARFDTTALTMRWPVPLRRLARVLIGSFSTALFALLIIAALLYTTFQNAKQMFLILCIVPLALVGGIAALWLTGINLNLSACV